VEGGAVGRLIELFAGEISDADFDSVDSSAEDASEVLS
jgi:hypothetical protein